MNDPVVSEAAIEFISNGYVAPLTKMERQPRQVGQFDGGVYYEDGSVCSRGAQIKFSFKNIPADIKSLTKPNFLEGRHIFCGLLQEWHFGHFLAESTSRLWAMREIGDLYSSLVFYQRYPGRRIPKFVTDMFLALGWAKPITVVQDITQIEHLAVPAQLAHTGYGYSYGHPSVRRLFAELPRSDVAGPKKIYVSRSRLNPAEGGVLLEDHIEANLVLEGYTVVHPQEMSISEQMDVYRSADVLIFAESSAIHLFAYLSRPTQKVYVVWRRGISKMFKWQIGTFGGPELQGRSCLKSLWLPEGKPDPQQNAKGVLDFEMLRSDLEDGGFISSRRWAIPTPEQLQEAMQPVQACSKYTYRNQPIA